jgi:high-affinity nickel-transport protein
LQKQAIALASGIQLQVNGDRLQLQTLSRHAIFAEGAGGLPTMKMAFVFRTTLTEANTSVPRRLSYNDANYSGHAGWKEVVVGGENGVSVVKSSAPSVDRSQELTNYSTDLLNSPPQQTSAMVEFDIRGLQETKSHGETGVGKRPVVHSGAGTVASPADREPSTENGAKGKPAFDSPTGSVSKGLSHTQSKESCCAAVSASNASGSVPLKANVQSTPRSRFTQLIPSQGKLTFWFLVSAAFIAAGLGALHALEPGHGKTIVAAYLVGSRGTARHAVLLGLVVTAAHTAGVYLLGIVTLYASRYIVPEQLYPWLSAISGLTVTGVGVFIFLRRLTEETGEHSHASGEKHSHWLTSMFRKSAPEGSGLPSTRKSAEPVSLRQLLALGITGGIVPCPAALVVLLSAFSLHRIGFGLFLITAFSLGLALVLVAVGLSMVYAKRALSRFAVAGWSQRYLPVASSAFMVILGLAIAVPALLMAFGSGLAAVPKDKLLPFATVTLLGLFLGVRHSTDPDHVVAVSTIVSRKGSIKDSATIGALWGLCHTLTIFLVGSAIIIFGVVIPPRLGLAMEFSVALMLILLGVLNLTGVLSWINARFTPRSTPVALSNTSAPAGVLDRTVGTLGVYQTLRPLFVGLVHGLAGSAAVALLVLSTIKSTFWATAYLLVFGVGTMGGMMLMTIAMSLPLVYTSKRHARTSRFITATSGFVSVAFGLFLVYQIGITDGLFSATPHWIPS